MEELFLLEMCIAKTLINMVMTVFGMDYLIYRLKEEVKHLILDKPMEELS